MTTPDALARAAVMRRAFDQSFAQPHAAEAAATVDLLAIRLGAHRYALRLSEIGGLYADKRVSPVPTSAPGLVGVAGFRGEILPVYDLRLLLGSAATAATRWLVVTTGTRVALAFDGLDGHLRLPRSAVTDGGGAPEAASGLVRGLASGAENLPLVDLAAVLETIARSAER